MANTTIRNLNSATNLNGADFLVIAQTDGTTKKVSLAQLTSNAQVITDSNGKPVSTNRFKIPVGVDSKIKGLDGIERSASNNWDDKAFMAVAPQPSRDPEAVRQTDFCHFVAVQQPTPLLILNRPFVSLDEALVWARYNIPAGADLQIEFWGSTTCFHNADSLGQFGTGTTADLNLNTLVFCPKSRWIGTYNDSTGFWDTNELLGQRWMPDLNFGGTETTSGTNSVYHGGAGFHESYNNRGGDGAGMTLNSLGTSRGQETYITNFAKNSWNWDYGSSQGFANTGSKMGTSFNGKSTANPQEICIHVGGSGSPLRFWFRHCKILYFIGCNWYDFAFGHNIHNHTFFRFSNGLVHFLGETVANVDASRHLINNQRGMSFYSKHESSTIMECTEGAIVYIMCNLRQYGVGLTESYWNKMISLRGEMASKGTNFQDENYNNSPSNFSGMTLGATHYSYWLSSPKQALTLARVGINSTGANQKSYVIFDPLASGWRRYIGHLCADNGDLKYPNGEKMIGYSLSNNFYIAPAGASDAQRLNSNETQTIPEGANLANYDPPDDNTVGFFTPPGIDWGESFSTDGRLLPYNGPLGWLLGDYQSIGMTAGSGTWPISRVYHSWGRNIPTYYLNQYDFFNGKVTPDNNSFIWDPRWGTAHAPAVSWNNAALNDNGSFVASSPGAIYGPSQRSNGDRVYSQRGYRGLALGAQNLFGNDAPSNHNPVHPDNYKFLNTFGGTDFMQMYFSDFNARQNGAIIFTPESAYNFTTDNAQIYLDKTFNILTYHGWVDYITGDYPGLLAMSQNLIGDSHMISFYSGNYDAMKTGVIDKYTAKMYLSNGTAISDKAVYEHPDGDFASYWHTTRNGVINLPTSKDVYYSNPAGLTTNTTASQSWAMFYYEPQAMFRYRGGFGNHLCEQFVNETPDGSSITIGGGRKLEDSIYPGLQRDITTAAKAIGNDRLVLHPLTAAIKASNGWITESGWFDENNSERSGDIPSRTGRVGPGDVGVKPLDVVFSLEAYREMKTCPIAFAIDRYSGERDYPREGGPDVMYDKNHMINGQASNMGKQQPNRIGGGNNPIGEWPS